GRDARRRRARLPRVRPALRRPRRRALPGRPGAGSRARAPPRRRGRRRPRRAPGGGGRMTPGPDRPLSRLRRLAAPRPVPRPAPGERCDLCAAPIPDVHRHLADVHRRALACACGACAILFDGRTAGPARYRLVPERRRELVGVALDDAAWDALGVPVATAFFFHATAADRVVACYPSPGGAIESLPPGDAWSAVVAAN